MGGMPSRDLPALSDQVVRSRATSLLTLRAGVAVTLVRGVSERVLDGESGEHEC